MNRHRLLQELRIVILASAVVFAATNASSQAPQPRVPVPRRVVPKLKLKQLPRRANLKRHLKLRGKKRLSRNMRRRMRAAVSYSRKGEPKLKLKSGKRVVLELVDQPGSKPSRTLLRKSNKLSPVLRRYKRYITKTPFLRDLKIKLPKTAPKLGVNHRSRQTSIKDQGSRNTCVAHAAVAGLESWYRWKSNVSRNLSEQHAFEIFMAREGQQSCNNVGLQTWRAGGYLTGARVCDNWAYSPSVPNCNLTVPSQCANDVGNGHTATKTLFSAEFGGAGATAATNTNYLEALLDQGNDVVYGVYVAGPDWSNGTLASGTVDVYLTSGGDPLNPYGGHAMLLVGYNRLSGYFEFKNSWGPGSGHAGYVRLSYEYVQAYGKYGYYITGATNP